LSQKFGTRFGGLNLIKIENFLDLWKGLEKKYTYLFWDFSKLGLLFFVMRQSMMPITLFF
jgi:hypothetical protein